MNSKKYSQAGWLFRWLYGEWTNVSRSNCVLLIIHDDDDEEEEEDRHGLQYVAELAIQPTGVAASARIFY